MRSVKWSALLLLLGGSVLAGVSVEHQAPGAKTQITLEVEMFGGFAYINDDGKLHAAYLKDTVDAKEDFPQISLPGVTRRPPSSCHVMQLGTDLKLISGEIVSPLPADPDRMWDLENAIVTFPGLAASTEELKATPGPRPVNGPAQPGVDYEWTQDLRWVPRISVGRRQADYPNHQRVSDWRSKVDGYVEIPRGVVKADHPSDHDLRWTLFEFKPRNATWNKEHPFVHALTDRVIWRAVVPSDRVVIALQNAKKAPSEIVIRPVRDNRVRLKLIGRHTHGTPASLEVGTELDHFCAFYELLETRTLPRRPLPFRDRLTPYVKQVLTPLTGTEAPSGSNGGQPSPGPLCPGIRFEP